MNEDPTSQKPAGTAGWWWIWILCVIGGPIATTVVTIVGSGQKQGATAVGLMFLFGGLALTGHAIASFMLGRRLELKRLPEHRQGAAIKIGLGLLFGGWCVMPVAFFLGCMVALAAQ